MGMSMRNNARRMTFSLHTYHVRRQEQRLKDAKIAGAGWARRTLHAGKSPERVSRLALAQAERWHHNMVQERIDAYLAGLYK